MYFINIGITYQYICCYRIASTWMGERLHSCLYFVWINLSKFTVRYIVWSWYSFHNIFHSDILEMMYQLTWFGVVLSIHKVSCCLKYPRPRRINGWWTIVTALYNITTSVLTSEMVLAFLTTSMKPYTQSLHLPMWRTLCPTSLVSLVCTEWSQIDREIPPSSHLQRVFGTGKSNAETWREVVPGVHGFCWSFSLDEMDLGGRYEAARRSPEMVTRHEVAKERNWWIPAPFTQLESHRSKPAKVKRCQSQLLLMSTTSTWMASTGMISTAHTIPSSGKP